MASQGSAWYVDFFRSDYLNVYGHMFTEERAEKESAFVARTLELEAGRVGARFMLWPGTAFGSVGEAWI